MYKLTDHLTDEQQAQMSRLTDRQTRTLARLIVDMAISVERRPWPFKSRAVRRVRKQAGAGSLSACLVLLELDSHNDG